MVMLPWVAARADGAIHAGGRSRDGDRVDKWWKILRWSKKVERYN